MGRSSTARLGALAFAALAGCASTPSPRENVAPARFAALQRADSTQLLDRITWGANRPSQERLAHLGAAAYLEEQLHPPGEDELPAEISARIASMAITQRPVAELAKEMRRRQREFNRAGDEQRKKAARQAFQQQMNGYAREAATRTLLRDIHSPHQLREQMTWFWMNHFNVHQRKGNLRVLVGDYEERAIRLHALGRFRDLVRASLRHPAMLIYLDNARNAMQGLNENYARELLELHTLGVDGGYTQHDVQELARVLTGVGVNASDREPKVRPALQRLYVRDGLFEFNPDRHDFRGKTILGHKVRGRGMDEVDEVIDILCRHPATARFVSRKLASFFVADEPPDALVDRVAATFTRTDGDIAETLATLFDSPEFAQSLGRKFKDPMHYVVSAVRLVHDDRPMPNPDPMLRWLARLGELPYDHQAPDGYPLVQAAWASPGQLGTRFEIARIIGSAPSKLDRAVSVKTRQAIEQAATPQERNALLLSSPDFMYR